MRVTHKNTQASFYRLAKFNFLTLKKGKYLGMIAALTLGAVLMFLVMGYFALVFAAMAIAYVPLSLLVAKYKVKKAFAKNPAFGELTYEFDFDEENKDSFHVTVTRREQTAKGKVKIKKQETVVPYYSVLRACKDKDRIYLYFAESTVVLPFDTIEDGTPQKLEGLLIQRVGNRFTTGKIDLKAYKNELAELFKAKEEAEQTQKANAADASEKAEASEKADEAKETEAFVPSEPSAQLSTQEKNLPQGEEKE